MIPSALGMGQVPGTGPGAGTLQAPAPVLVMVVEDDEDIREVLSMALGEAGYAVKTAADGVDAMRQLMGGVAPAVILLDMMMPLMDGEAVIHALRRNPGLAGIPVVLLSGGTGVRRIAEELHVQAYLVKPIELDELTSTVARLLTVSGI